MPGDKHQDSGRPQVEPSANKVNPANADPSKPAPGASVLPGQDGAGLPPVPPPVNAPVPPAKSNKRNNKNDSPPAHEPKNHQPKPRGYTGHALPDLLEALRLLAVADSEDDISLPKALNTAVLAAVAIGDKALKAGTDGKSSFRSEYDKFINSLKDAFSGNKIPEHIQSLMQDADREVAQATSQNPGLPNFPSNPIESPVGGGAGPKGPNTRV